MVVTVTRDNISNLDLNPLLWKLRRTHNQLTNEELSMIAIEYRRLENIFIIARFSGHILVRSCGMKWMQIIIYLTSCTWLNLENPLKMTVIYS